MPEGVVMTREREPLTKDEFRRLATLMIGQIADMPDDLWGDVAQLIVQDKAGWDIEIVVGLRFKDKVEVEVDHLPPVRGVGP
jgi:hypothetical protein